MADVLDVELQTYEKSREHLLATAEGKYVLIHKKRVVDVFCCKEDAISQGYKRLGVVPFLVKQITRTEILQLIF